MTQVFRKAALERLSSPDQLDQLVQVTRPSGWIALSALVTLLLAALVWGFLGTIPTRVNAVGILVHKGGLDRISPKVSGLLGELYVHAGSEVEAGGALARIHMPDLERQLLEARAHLTDLESAQQRRSRAGEEDLQLQSQALAQEELAARNTMEAARIRADSLQAQLAAQQKLLDQGLVTEQLVRKTRDEISQARIELATARAALSKLSVRRAQLKTGLVESDAERRATIAEAQRTVAALDQQLEQSAVVRAPNLGRVIEVRAALGQQVTEGVPLLTMQLHGSGYPLEALLFAPGGDAKHIRTAMGAVVSPATARPEEYGSMVAAVTSVAPFPASRVALLATLGNEEIVDAFLRQSPAAIEVRADIRIHPNREDVEGVSNMFEWTSGNGPPYVIHSGTLCTASITVSERRPITFVIPALRKLLGL